MIVERKACMTIAQIAVEIGSVQDRKWDDAHRLLIESINDAVYEVVQRDVGDLTV